MGNHRVLGFHFIFISMFLVATPYTCLGFRNTSVVCYEQERLALLKFKHSVRDDFGMLSSWVGNDCCRWKRIHCDRVTGNVESVSLTGNFIIGEHYYYELVGDGDHYLVGIEVNSSLKELSHLKYLDLSGNDFQGSQIPPFIGSFKELRYLYLSNTGFYGIVPHCIGNLTNLKVLDLGLNRKLIIDDMAWTVGLTSLKHLDLSWLNLFGAQNWDMVFYVIPLLKELRLFQCGLFNAGVGHSLNSSRILPSIKLLDLGRNLFTGPLPLFLQNTSLEFLDLSMFSPNLAWNFADLLNLIPSLSELHLSLCGLDSKFLFAPHLNFSTLSKMKHLDLTYNSIGGVFPSILTNISSLRILELSGNWLNSCVPIMPNLLQLHLSYNQFKQIDQVGIWRWCHLQLLSVSHNADAMIGSSENVSECSQYALERLHLDWSLNGMILEPFGRLTNLRGLHLASGRLTGLIPESVRRLRSLEVLDLSHNQLTGPIPTFLGKLSKLDLSYNQLNGSIPESIGELAALTDLDLQYNQLYGSIPVSIGQLAKLHSLAIAYNSLDGVVLDAHFSNLSMLKVLDTSFNTKLTFNVSSDWRPPFQLITLNLDSCNIGNRFPQWLRNQKKLVNLVLSNASISGPLPLWLRKIPIIPFIDLSHNNISGPLSNLPEGVSVYVSAYRVVPWALILENNVFSEPISRSLCRRTALQYLDLSRNMFTGEIPKCLENLKSLSVMIFSSNRLSGVVPSSIASSSLFELQLNDNDFIGELMGFA